MSDPITVPAFSAIAQECIPALKFSTRWLRAAATNFTADFGALNQSVKVLAVGTADEAREFDHSTGYGQQDSKLLETTVSLEKRIVSESTMDDSTFDSLNASTLSGLLTEGINKVVSKAEQIIGGKILASVATHSIAVDSANFSASSIKAIRQEAVKMGLPAPRCSAVLNPLLYTGLISDVNIMNNNAVDVSRTALVEGEIRRIAGWNTYEAPGLPDNGEGLCGLVLHPSAIAVAVRPVYTPGLTYFEVITDDDTGFSISVKVVSDTIHAKVSVIAETLVGAAVVQPDAILRLTESSDTGDENP